MSLEKSNGSGRRVAIACQGGGSHTAFTAGVLGRLLSAEELDDYRVVGLSGTSGGAVCALLAWSALRDGDRRGARERLEGFWADNSASSPLEAAVNAWTVWAATLQSTGALPAISPYDLADHRDGAASGTCSADGWTSTGSRRIRSPAHPLLLIGAVDVLSGRFRAFHSRHDRITADMVLASAAIPTAFRTVHTDGGSYWDGLFSQNPPVHDLLEARTGRAVGDPDQPDDPAHRAPQPARHRRPTQRTLRQSVAVPGAPRHREDRPVARPGRPGRRRVQAGHRAHHRAPPPAVDAAGSGPHRSSIATAGSSATS